MRHRDCAPDVKLGKDNLIPDLAIVCRRERIRPDGIYGAPDLVVEILSPRTGRRDKTIKKAAYEAAGVREYWIVSPEERSVDVYLLQDGKFVLDNVYAAFEDWQWEQLTEEEKAAAQLSLKVSFYDDLVVDVGEIFEDI